MNEPRNCLFTARFVGQLMWIATAAALLGAGLNVQQHRAGFAVWMVTNGLWAVYDWWIGERAQAVLFAVYFGLAVWGWFAWAT